MKRYAMEQHKDDYGDCYVIHARFDDNGEWVKYSDVSARISALEKALTQIQRTYYDAHTTAFNIAREALEDK